jgi:hypothetical protein
VPFSPDMCIRQAKAGCAGPAAPHGAAGFDAAVPALVSLRALEPLGTLLKPPVHSEPLLHTEGEGGGGATLRVREGPILRANDLARQPRPLAMVLHAIDNAGCRLHALVRRAATQPVVSPETGETR